ncbi:hypothetical protein AAFF27_13210 [Xylophilus sp. GW821-FHT01B05]
MTAPAQIQRLERLIWVFIYVGLLTLIVGVVVHDTAERLGQCLIVGGGFLALIGAGMVLWRARLDEDG